MKFQFNYLLKQLDIHVV